MTKLVITMGEQRIEADVPSGDVDAGEPVFEPVVAEARVFGEIGGLEIETKHEEVRLGAGVTL